ncbi:hypothetical protein [Mesonia maritima]|uniref:Uncharacterized protein n=1 Tax=Mesonia maritima TaxID=1793873 RepID=A0ABU1K8F2_9FLAO|nr:hypothetical protein [Mesonia maritima]MDR6301894.1 hypothetical protein [Mesonia maritima]
MSVGFKPITLRMLLQRFFIKHKAKLKSTITDLKEFIIKKEGITPSFLIQTNINSGNALP